MLSKLICWLWSHKYFDDHNVNYKDDGTHDIVRTHYSYCPRCGKQFKDEGFDKTRNNNGF